MPSAFIYVENCSEYFFSKEEKAEYRNGSGVKSPG